MNNPTIAGADHAIPAVRAEKRVILSMGGKGGVGKTSVIVGLAEWFGVNHIPIKLLDLDTENKARGSLAYFFGNAVPKLNIQPTASTPSWIIWRTAPP